MLARQAQHVVERMRIAQARQQAKVGAVAVGQRLEREAEHAARHRAADARERGREIADIDEHVGGDDEVEALVGGVEEFDDVGVREAIVDAEPTRLGQHALGEIDTGQSSRQGPQERAAEAGAAAEVERRVVAGAGERDEPLDEAAMSLVAKRAHDVGIEVVGVAVEEAGDVGARRRRHGARLDRCQVELVQRRVGAVAQRFAERPRRLVEAAGLAQQRAEAAPGRGMVRVEGEQAPERRQRVLGAAELRERGRAVEQRIGAVALDGEGRVGAGERVVRPRQAQLDRGQVDQRRRATGHERQRGLVAALGLGEVAGLLAGEAGEELGLGGFEGFVHARRGEGEGGEACR